MPHQLSGGEQQRVAIARALLNSPELILADEPTGNLDNETAKGIMDLLYEINKSNHTAIIMVTHNQNLLKQYPGRVFLCADNTCKEEVSGAIDLDIEV
jgi:cell division transport system ATP-binding protein